MLEIEHRKTCRRFNEAGHAHALTFSCFQRRQFLSKVRSTNWMIDAIDKARRRYYMHLWAYVIMPEHVHLLVWPAEEIYSISNFLKGMKQTVANQAVTWVRRHAPDFLASMEDRAPNGSVNYRFWQRGGGFDRNITSASAVLAEIEYLHANPVRRGLCRRAVDWQWSSAAEYENPGAGPLSLDRDSLPTLVIR